ncbi:hypothetical protein [Streptomyces daliensis]
MADIIDPTTHADLIALQRTVHERFAELDSYAADVSGIDLTDEQRAHIQALREAVRQAVEAKDAALRDSGLTKEHGNYTPVQSLKDAAKASASPDASGDEDAAADEGGA